MSIRSSGNPRNGGSPGGGYVRHDNSAREAEVAAEVAAAKARAAAAPATSLDITVTLPPLAEGRAPAPELAEDWLARLPDSVPESEPAEKPRCERCGYVLAKCDCKTRFWS